MEGSSTLLGLTINPPYVACTVGYECIMHNACIGGLGNTSSLPIVMVNVVFETTPFWALGVYGRILKAPIPQYTAVYSGVYGRAPKQTQPRLYASADTLCHGEPKGNHPNNAPTKCHGVKPAPLGAPMLASKYSGYTSSQTATSGDRGGRKKILGTGVQLFFSGSIPRRGGGVRKKFARNFFHAPKPKTDHLSSREAVTKGRFVVNLKRPIESLPTQRGNLCIVCALRATFRLCSPRRAPEHTPWKRP